MEGMEETKKSEAHLTSAAAFVEGGIQDACDDACSICLESFCDSDPSTLTTCKHEFHLQCVLEWCQRSAHCPMCWQPISLKDPTSQELLDAVTQERNVSRSPPRNATIFHHPTLGDFELHLPVGLNDSELEERIIQHLAAAAATGRRIPRREGRRIRSSAQARPQFLVFSTQSNSSSSGPMSSSATQRDGGGHVPQIAVVTSSSPPTDGEQELQNSRRPDFQADQVSASTPESSVGSSRQGNSSNNRRSPNQSSPNSQDRAGPSDLLSFSESIKSKFNAVSMKYKESITKSTRGWKERFFSRNTTMADIGSEVRREVTAGIATVSRMMERLDTKDNGTSSAPNNGTSSAPNRTENDSVAESNEQRTVESRTGHPVVDTEANANINVNANELEPSAGHSVVDTEANANINVNANELEPRAGHPVVDANTNDRTSCAAGAGSS